MPWLSELYSNTVGPFGQSFNDHVTAPVVQTLGHAGQTFNDHITAPAVESAGAIMGAPAYWIKGTEQNATDAAGAAKQAFGGAGQAFHNAGTLTDRTIGDTGQTVRDFGQGAKETVKTVSHDVTQPFNLAGLGIAAVAGLILILAYNESKNPKLTKAAAEGAARGAKYA